ncbi:MAG: DUF3516 domain-containing protein, partial [Verrucomicrobiota bacterium]
LEEKVGELVDAGRAPIYLVHFTQLACARTAQNLLSQKLTTKDEKRAISEEIAETKFNSPYGKELTRVIKGGIGIHHAGLLPRYRLLVEKLAQKGLLKVICGTDTLGVGINVPIRTVVLTQLCKFDGSGTHLLRVRDFQQICGRAGRRGFDEEGFVVAQAPEHVIENIKIRAKAEEKNRKPILKRAPEKGFVPWDEGTFQKLIKSDSETLKSRFQLQPNHLLLLLGRDGEDGCEAARQLIRSCHEADPKKKAIRQKSWKIVRDLLERGVLEIIPRSERNGPQKLRLSADLPEQFSLHEQLGIWLLDAIPQLDSTSLTYPFDLLSLVEAITENPVIILRKQTDKAKTELLAELKAEGVDYDERIERLERVTWPKPGADFIYATFNEFLAKCPWIDSENIRPKSIAREMFEDYCSFADYITRYGLERSEGVLLRHLSSVYTILRHTVPETAKTEPVEEAERFLETVLRETDSTLLEEWSALQTKAAL